MPRSNTLVVTPTTARYYDIKAKKDSSEITLDVDSKDVKASFLKGRPELHVGFHESWTSVFVCGSDQGTLPKLYFPSNNAVLHLRDMFIRCQACSHDDELRFVLLCQRDSLPLLVVHRRDGNVRDADRESAWRFLVQQRFGAMASLFGIDFEKYINDLGDRLGVQADGPVDVVETL